MNDVKTFFEQFAFVEAETATLKRKPELEKYNTSVKSLYSFYVQLLYGSMGYMTIEELEDDDFYEIFEGNPPANPRHLFKISKYAHDKYGDVWIVYASTANPADANFKILSDALFIIKEKDDFKIAKRWNYSNYESDGKYYQWEEGKGYPDISFETLTGPIEIKRYQEPAENLDGLKLYNDNI